MYKFLKKEYLNEFREKGKVHIGNIKYYREHENKEKADPHEGKTTYNIFAKDKPINLSIKQLNAVTNDDVIEAPLAVAPNSFFQSDLVVPNAFVFCLSKSKNGKVKKWFKTDNYYKIKNINKFIQLVQKEIEKPHPGCLMIHDSVKYVPTKIINITNENKDKIIRTMLYDKTKSDKIKTIHIEDYFIKTEEFSTQEEYRIVFIPKGPISDEPLYIECPELVELCEF